MDKQKMKIDRVFISPVSGNENSKLRPFSLSHVEKVDYLAEAAVITTREFDKETKKVTPGRLIEHVWPYHLVNTIQVTWDRVTEPINGDEVWTKSGEEGVKFMGEMPGKTEDR